MNNTLLKAMYEDYCHVHNDSVRPMTFAKYVAWQMKIHEDLLALNGPKV